MSFNSIRDLIDTLKSDNSQLKSENNLLKLENSQFKEKDGIFSDFMKSLGEMEFKEFIDKYGQRLEEMKTIHGINEEQLKLKNMETLRLQEEKHAIRREENRIYAEKMAKEMQEREEENQKAEVIRQQEHEEFEKTMKESNDKMKIAMEKFTKSCDETTDKTKEAKEKLVSECPTLEKLYEYFGITSNFFDENKDKDENSDAPSSMMKALEKLSMEDIDLNDYLSHLETYFNTLLLIEHQKDQLGGMAFLICALRKVSKHY